MSRQNHSYQSEDGHCVFGSLSAGVDLMEGILEECRKHDIHSGVVTCIGSLQKTGYVLFNTIEGSPSGYSRKIKVEEPVELINGTGFICADENNELDLHFHGLVSKENGELSAGHFLRGENPTLITVEFSINQSSDIHAYREYDEGLGFRVINFSK